MGTEIGYDILEIADSIHDFAGGRCTRNRNVIIQDLTNNANALNNLENHTLLQKGNIEDAFKQKLLTKGDKKIIKVDEINNINASRYLLDMSMYDHFSKSNKTQKHTVASYWDQSSQTVGGGYIGVANVESVPSVGKKTSKYISFKPAPRVDNCEIVITYDDNIIRIPGLSARHMNLGVKNLCEILGLHDTGNTNIATQIKNIIYQPKFSVGKKRKYDDSISNKSEYINQFCDFLSKSKEHVYMVKRSGDYGQIAMANALKNPDIPIVFVTGDRLCFVQAIKSGVDAIYPSERFLELKTNIVVGNLTEEDRLKILLTDLKEIIEKFSPENKPSQNLESISSLLKTFNVDTKTIQEVIVGSYVKSFTDKLDEYNKKFEELFKKATELINTATELINTASKDTSDNTDIQGEKFNILDLDNLIPISELASFKMKEIQMDNDKVAIKDLILNKTSDAISFSFNKNSFFPLFKIKSNEISFQYKINAASARTQLYEILTSTIINHIEDEKARYELLINSVNDILPDTSTNSSESAGVSDEISGGAEDDNVNILWQLNYVYNICGTIAGDFLYNNDDNNQFINMNDDYSSINHDEYNKRILALQDFITEIIFSEYYYDKMLDTAIYEEYIQNSINGLTNEIGKNASINYIALYNALETKDINLLHIKTVMDKFMHHPISKTCAQSADCPDTNQIQPAPIAVTVGGGYQQHVFDNVTRSERLIDRLLMMKFAKKILNKRRRK